MAETTKYKVTGILTNGKRFKAIHTNNYNHAMSINLYRGNVWQNVNNKWQRIKEVWN